MKTNNFTKFVNGLRTSIVKHSPEILTGIGIAGMITSTILAVRATPKALVLISDAEIAKRDAQAKAGKGPDELDGKLTPVETIKVAWKPYVPAAIAGVAGVACIIGASSVSAKRNAALMTAYKLSETAIAEYKAKVIETIGEKKEKVVREKLAEDKVKNDPVTKKEVFITNKGNTLCYDYQSGRYFESDIDKIKKAENELNKRMLNEMYISLNEFYDELGLKPTKLGSQMGWNLDGGLIELEFSSQIADDGRPCLVIDFSAPPKYNYSKFL